MSGIPLGLLPDTAVVADDGRLEIGGCDVLQLAADFGTPLFIYDEDHIRARCREAVLAFGADNVVYATKAFLCKAIAALVHEEGLLLDVATGGEMHVTLAAGVPADRLVLHGNNKSLDELSRALVAGVHHVVVDSFDELDRLDALYRSGLPRPRVQLRITPGIEAHTHEYVRTGQADSKFGFGLEGGVADAAIARAARSDSVELIGLHTHIGSQIFAAESFASAAQIMADIINRFELPTLTLGGGLGVAYVDGETAPSITEWGKVAREALDRAGCRAVLSVEPGRALVAAAAVTLYTVGTIKEIPGIRTYVAVDGGMSDNPRPVLYGSGYEAFLPRATGADRHRPVRIVGKHCESGDVLVYEAFVPEDLTVGDTLCTPVTGAYGHSMGSNYNKVTRPPVVFVRDGHARLVVRRETLDDLTRLDVDERATNAYSPFVSIDVSELELPYIDLVTTQTRDERRRLLDGVRRSNHWLARTPGGYLVTTYEDSVTLLRDRRFHQFAAKLAELAGVTDAEFLARRRPSILTTEGDEHARLRRLVAPAFTPKAAARFRPAMRDVLNALLDPFTPTGRIELVADVCEPYPIPIICRLLGAPEEDWRLFSTWASDLLRIFNFNFTEDLPIIMKAQEEVGAYVRELIEQRRRQPGEDLLTDLIAAEEEGDRLSTEELESMAVAVLVAGTDTTRNQLGCAVALFTDYPDQWALLRERPELAPRAVEECMRYLGAVGGTLRFASEDVEFKGVRFPKDTVIAASFVAGNRDERVFPTPETFDITKEASAAQLTFGSGIHYCLGAWLARAELQEALPILAQRLPEMTVDGAVEWKPNTVGIWGPARLPLAFTAG